VRRRVLLAIVGVTAAAVTVFALPLGFAVGRIYRDDELIRLERTATAATLQVDLRAGAADPVELPPGGDTELAYYDRSGRRVAGRGPAIADAPVLEALRRGTVSDHSGDGRLAVAVPVASAERVAGAMRAGRSDAELTSRVSRARLLLAALGAVVVLGAAAAALLLSRRLTRPLERLADAARRLGHGDFTVRAPRAGVAELDAVGGALDSTAERLDRLLARERAFSADASHQLRTPLAALRIEIEADALDRPAGDGAGAARALEQVDRLEETIDALLAVARDEQRPVEPLDLRELLREVGDAWRGPLAEYGRPLRIAVEADVPAVRGDHVVVRQVIDVLVDNACRHGGGVVTVAARAAGAGAAIEVSDEGAGFDGDTERYFARRGGAAEGHGIGLALARSLAAAEGGMLTLDRASPPLFVLRLPGARPDRAGD
jgi:signal transduction histidine kinase